jgi:hypothetical protein
MSSHDDSDDNDSDSDIKGIINTIYTILFLSS